MQKNYILDTNVLIDDPYAIFNFEDNTVYIPIYAIEELDKIKTEANSIRGRSARTSCRILDDLRKDGDLAKGVTVQEGKIIIYVPKERKRIKVGLDENSMDNAILQAALEIKEKEKSKDKETILVTMDVNLRVRAQVLGLHVESYEHNTVDSAKLLTGMLDVEVETGVIDELFKNKILPAQLFTDLYENVCVSLTCKATGQSALTRYRDGAIRPIENYPNILGIAARSKEQRFALDLLMDDTIKVVTLVGKSGSGKTLMGIAAGLSKVLDNKYKRLLVSRPVVPMGGKDNIGFLPGGIGEKLDPYMQPIYDNLEALTLTKRAGKSKQSEMDKMYGTEKLFEDGVIRIEPLTYIRGRSISKQFLLVDEAQNLSGLELRTVMTRCGEGTKVVLTGDPSQIDSPYLDKSNCGINIAAEKLYNQSIVGHVVLQRGERSPLANLAAEML